MYAEIPSVAANDAATSSHRRAVTARERIRESTSVARPGMAVRRP
jgi:hypothetical protein